jgi:hypothetical protein
VDNDELSPFHTLLARWFVPHFVAVVHRYSREDGMYSRDE